MTKTLKALSNQKSLTMTITAGATNLTGAPTSTVTTVKLKGQAADRPPRRSSTK